MANLGFTAVATVNGVVAGLGVHAGLTFLLVLHLDMGVRGAALVQMSVKACQVAVWLVAALRHDRALFVPQRGSARTDPLWTRAELRVYLGQALPEYAGSLSSWAIFELQMVLLTNIRAIPDGALSAGM